jgi:ribose transport system ATP-binding protein
MFTLIREVACRGAAVICASTDPEELAAICDRVVFLSSGRITEAASAP